VYTRFLTCQYKTHWTNCSIFQTGLMQACVNKRKTGTKPLKPPKRRCLSNREARARAALPSATQLEAEHQTETTQLEAEQQPEEQDLQRAINSRLHATRHCIAGLCEYCEATADVCIHCTRGETWFSHTCLTHQWECINTTTNNHEDTASAVFQIFNLNG
jgi:hypothetical protein